jgi:hypothetical protein
LHQPASPNDEIEVTPKKKIKKSFADHSARMNAWNAQKPESESKTNGYSFAILQISAQEVGGGANCWTDWTGWTKRITQSVLTQGPTLEQTPQRGSRPVVEQPLTSQWDRNSYISMMFINGLMGLEDQFLLVFLQLRITM